MLQESCDERCKVHHRQAHSDRIHRWGHKEISKKKAFEELDNIMSSKLLVIEPVIEQDWKKSITYFRKYSDHQIDMTDCLSLAIMEWLQLKMALTFDDDFKIHGFENLK